MRRIHVHVEAILASFVASTLAFGQADWTQKLVLNSPSKRMYPAMAQAGSGGVEVVMFGGLNLGPPGVFNQFNVLGDTWIWDGSGWTQAAVSVSPPPRYGASMAFDRVSGKAVLFGGEDASDHFLGDTWLFESRRSCPTRGSCTTVRSWTQVTTAVSPPARADASMEPDRFLRGPDLVTPIIVLTGGVTKPGLDFVYLNDTWRFNPTLKTWTKESPPSAVGGTGAQSGILTPGRSGAAMAICDGDADLNGAFLFGGFNGSFQGPLGDTLLHGFRAVAPRADDVWWPADANPSPAARFGARMARYPVSNRAVLYGGQGTSPSTNQAAALTDTWNGYCTGSPAAPDVQVSEPFPSWSQATPLHNPGPRIFHGLSTGPNGFTLVLFGGDDLTFPRGSGSSFPNGRDKNDTWTWGRRVACLPIGGSEVSVGSDVDCQFDRAGGIQFEGWSVDGFARPFRGEDNATFHTESPGPATITARWTDADGSHSETFSYTITKKRKK